MRTGGAGLSQSSESLHSAAKTGPAVSIGARGCSMTRGALPSGIEICEPRRTADRISANIARAVASTDEVAETIRWLATDAPASATGSVIDVNGASYVRAVD